MNKEKFIEELSIKTNYDNNKCIIINEILENYFIIGKNNKQKILNELKTKLSLEEDEANKIYEISITILLNGLKEKIKNPFKSLD